MARFPWGEVSQYLYIINSASYLSKSSKVRTCLWPVSFSQAALRLQWCIGFSSKCQRAPVNPWLLLIILLTLPVLPNPWEIFFGNNQIEISFLLLCMTTCTYLSAMMSQNFSPEPRKHYDTKSRIGKNGPREIKWIVFLLKHTNPGVTRHQLCGMVCWSYKVNNTKHTRIHSLILHGSDMCRFRLPWFN